MRITVLRVGKTDSNVAAGKTCGKVAHKVLVMNKSIARNVVLCEKISNRQDAGNKLIIINKSVCSAKRSFRKGCRENPIERVVPLRLCILSSYKERMCRVQGGISACIGLIGALLAIRPVVRLCTE